jgi:ABC-type dipeptide/oligopeptide/nickel transport system ATPase component
MIVRKSILGKEIAYIPQAAMNALNPTRKIINFIEDVLIAHDLYTNKKEFMNEPEGCLRLWVFRQVYWKNIPLNFRAA